MTVHLRLDGTWATCHATQRACPRRFHVSDMDATEARLLPDVFMDQLLNTIDPPDDVEADGRQVWRDATSGQVHRDYDLPAVIHPDGTREWYQYGKRDRGYDRPAVVDADGSLDWYQAGLRHRDGDKPASITVRGTHAWFQRGKKHRTQDKPAIIRASGIAEWWYQGKFVRNGTVEPPR